MKHQCGFTVRGLRQSYGPYTGHLEPLTTYEEDSNGQINGQQERSKKETDQDSKGKEESQAGEEEG